MNKTLIGLIALGMLVAAPVSLAVGGVASSDATSRSQGFGGAVGGLMSANADAEAHYGVDYSGAIATADDAKDKAKATLDGALDTAGDAAAQVAADGQMTAQKGTTTSVEAKSSILGGIQENLAAFGGWVSSLWVKPEVHAPAAAASDAAHVAKDLQTEIRPGYVGADGIAHGDLTQDLTGGAGVQYNLPPPPQPKVNFATSLKMAFESFFHLG